MHRRHFRAAVLCLTALFVIISSVVRAQTNAGTIRGVVRGPDGKPMASVPVQLRNDITGFKSDTTSGADGSFQFFSVPFNPYEIHVDVQGFRPIHQSVDVRSSVPREVVLALELPTVQATVVVASEPTAAQLETDTTTSHIDIDKSYIARVPAAAASRAMEEIVTSTPGFAKDENGRFHFQGAHSQSEYVIDGQTISDQTGVTFSNSIDPGIAQSLEVVYGNIPAEYGEKIGAVINMVTKSGLNRPTHGDVAGGYATFDTYDASASAGGGGQRFGYFVSLSGSGSDYFTDPVNFDNLHNNGDTQRGFIRLDGRSADSSDSFRLSALLGRTDRDVTNTFTQEDGGVRRYGQDARPELQRGLAIHPHVLDGARRDRVRAHREVHAVPLGRGFPGARRLESLARQLWNHARVHAHPRDERDPRAQGGGGPEEVSDQRVLPLRNHGSELQRSLLSPTTTRTWRHMTSRAAARDFEFSASTTGTYVAGFLQDTIRWNNLTAALGLRYDSNSLPAADRQLEPRVGVAYYVEKTGTVLRGAYNRVLYTPEYENILLSSSEEAASIAPPEVQETRALGGGVLLVHSERQDYWTFGVQQAIGSSCGSTPTTGSATRRARATRISSSTRGSSSRWPSRAATTTAGTSGSTSPRPWGFRGFLSLGHVHVVYVPPPAGGLFLDAGAIDDITGGPFLIDHDQKLQLQTGLFYDIGTTGVWLGTNVRYDSGLVSGAAPEDLVGDPDNEFAIPYINTDHAGTDLDPYRIKPRTVVDFSLGADLTRYHVPVTVQLMVLNATDVKGLYNILSTFGGHARDPAAASRGASLVRVLSFPQTHSSSFGRRPGGRRPLLPQNNQAPLAISAAAKGMTQTIATSASFSAMSVRRLAGGGAAPPRAAKRHRRNVSIGRISSARTAAKSAIFTQKKPFLR